MRVYQEIKPLPENIRAQILIDEALRLREYSIEGEIPIFKETRRLFTYKDAFSQSEIGPALMPRQFLLHFGKVGDSTLEIAIRERLQINGTCIEFNAAQFASDIEVRHKVEKSGRHNGLFLSHQEATDLIHGVHGLRCSILVTPRNLTQPREYNSFLAKLVQANGNHR